MVGGEVRGRSSRHLVLSLKLPSSTWVLQKSSERYCDVYSLRRRRDPALRLCYFLTALPWSLHPLPSLISNCLNLPFGTQGRSMRLKPFSCQQEKGTQKGFYTQEGPAGSCSISPVLPPPKPLSTTELYTVSVWNHTVCSLFTWASFI